MNDHITNTLTRREAERLLASEVATIAGRTPDDRLRWTGTTKDLMEALYVAFLTATLRDDDGNGLSFLHIVRHCCTVLHTRIPLNPHDVARRAMNRKGMKSLPFLDRYLWLKEQHPHIRPFCRLVAGLEQPPLEPDEACPGT